MKSLDALILVEHVDRELDVAALIKALALRHNPNLRIEIANFYTETQRLIASVSPKVVITPFFYEENEPAARDYTRAWPKATWLNLAWEQILYGSQQTLKRPRDRFTRERVHHIAWSDWYGDYLRTHGVHESQIHICGHPLFDLYTDSLRDYYPDRKMLARHHGLDTDKRWILFPENFRWAFMTNARLRVLTQQGVSEGVLRAQRDYCEETLTITARWLAALARTGEVEIILRPRPAVSSCGLESFIASGIGEIPKGLHILKDHSVREWVLASDIVISSNSTSLVEAAIAGKPVYRAESSPPPPSLRYSWAEKIPLISGRLKMLSAALGAYDYSGTQSLQDWAVDSFRVGAYPSAAQMIADLITDLAETAAQFPPKQRSTSSAWASAVTCMITPRWRHRLRAQFQEKYFFNAETHEKDLFGEWEVRTRVTKWRRLISGEALL